MRRFLSPMIFLLCLLAMHGLHWLDRWLELGGIPWPWTLWGLAPALVGMVWNLSLSWRFHRLGTTIKPFETSSALVIDGPYRLSRNPMYLGQVLILVGAAVLHGTWLAFAPVPVLIVILDLGFIRAEERLLGETFGEAYEAYRRRVRRWL